MIQQGSRFPNMFLSRPDGTSMELWDLSQRWHGIIIFADGHESEIQAFVSHYQDKAKLFEWLKTKLVVVYKNRDRIPTPWPAPAYPPCFYPDQLPDGLEWGHAYAMSRFRSCFEVYPEAHFMSTVKVEEDVMYYEANHC